MPTTALQIVDNAAALFAARGFRVTTIREIADRASVNQATVFRHFRNGKWELSRAAIDHLALRSEYRLKLGDSLNKCDASNLLSIENLILFCYDFKSENENFLNIVRNAITENNLESEESCALSRDTITRYIGPLKTFVLQYCDKARQLGTLTGDMRAASVLLTSVVLNVLFGDIFWDHDHETKEMSQLQRKELARDVTEQWLYGANYQPAGGTTVSEFRING